ncbi:MAG: CHAT domain-containing protein, partial [Rhodospirillales bacterium]|nr:CHAT domain-containing protein [Rhodospirillales bacterium]
MKTFLIRIVVCAVWVVTGVIPETPLAQVNEEKAGENIQAFQALMDQGTLNNNLARFKEAEESFRQALDLCRTVTGANERNCADVLVRIALEVSNQKKYEEADLLFKQAENLIESSQDPLGKPRLLTYQGMGLANQGEFEKALGLILDANERRKGVLRTLVSEAAQGAKAGRGGSAARKRIDHAMGDLSHGLYVQATILFRLKRYDDALITAHLARRLILKVESVPGWWAANADELIAAIELRQGKKESAEKRLLLALETKRVALGNTRAVAMTHLALGSVYDEGRRHLDSLKAMRPGLAIVRGELGQSSGIEIEQILPFLHSAYALAGKEQNKRDLLYGEMFGASQLVWASGTANVIARVAARFSSARPEVSDLVQKTQEAEWRRDQIRLELGRLSIQSGGAERAARIRSRKAAYAEAVKAAQEMKTKLEAVFPDYSRLTASKPVTVSELGKILAPDEALFKVVIGEKSGFAFLIRKGRVFAAPLHMGRKALNEAVRHLRRPFENQGDRIAAFDLAASYRLYQGLLGSFAGQLQGVRHLVIVPAEALLSLPFALLVTQPPPAQGSGSYGRAAWLAKDMASSLMPTVRAFSDLRVLARPSTAPKPFIGFGNPAYSGVSGAGGLNTLADLCQSGAPVPPELIRGLAPLPETANEIRQVATAFKAGPDSVFLGEAVSEERLRSLALDQYRTVYFAT